MGAIDKQDPQDQQDQKEFHDQVNAEPELWHSTFEVFDPKVKIVNECFPHAHEIYNCTNCTRAEPEHPAYKLKNPERFRVKCKHIRAYSEGPRWNDIGCPYFDAKLRRELELNQGGV